jgi:hypothetical protein
MQPETKNAADYDFFMDMAKAHAKAIKEGKSYDPVKELDKIVVKETGEHMGQVAVENDIRLLESKGYKFTDKGSHIHIELGDNNYATTGREREALKDLGASHDNVKEVWEYDPISGKKEMKIIIPIKKTPVLTAALKKSSVTGGSAGGSGECCVFNEYGGGGCGPCNRGGGPELQTGISAYDNLFGTEKHADMPIQPYVNEETGRVFFRFYAIGPGINRHDWAVNADHIADNMPSIIDSDITFMRVLDQDEKPYYPHPALPGADAMTNQLFQKQYKVAKTIDYERKPDEKGNWYAIGEALEPHIKEYMAELAKAGMDATKTKSASIPIFVSPQILHYKDQDPHDIKKFYFQHITFTDDPAFPPAFAKVTGACVGEEPKCLAELKHASMSRLELMPCFKMAMEEIVKKNSSQHNTSLIAKRATNSLENSMSEQSKNETPKGNEVNENTQDISPLKPEFAQQHNIEAGKVPEEVNKLVSEMIHDQSLSPREKGLLAQLEALSKATKEKDGKISELTSKFEERELKDKRRDVELILIGYEKAFTKDGKFDEKAFNEEVDYWLKSGKSTDDIQANITRAMKYVIPSEPTKTQQPQYASNSGQSSDGETLGQVFEAPKVGVNLEETETRQASMSELLDTNQIYYLKKGGRIA